MKEIVCTLCPNGCQITVDEDTLSTSGNRCPRGKTYAVDELKCPKRSVTTTVKTIFKDKPTASVKTSQNIEKKYIFDLIKLLGKIILKERVKPGTVILENVFGTGVNIITTCDME